MIVSIENLNELGDVTFEKLIKALLFKVIGAGITPFATGKDGAREAKFTGEANYPSDIERWKGNWIFQVKFANIGFGVDKARDQVKYQINNELKKLENYGYIEDEQLQNYIFVTNVPFTGEAEKGLHDYIAKKKLEFKVPNFDYWDGEKVVGFLHHHAQVLETFFQTKGLRFFDENEVQKLKEVYVAPTAYAKLKAYLLAEKQVAIVGQAHVGKTSMALSLALDVFESLKLNGYFMVNDISAISDNLNISNCIVVFDDLYGDIFYTSIGRKSKSIEQLKKKDNYIIITSRDYISEEALINRENIHISKENDLMLFQEGVYSDLQLHQVLTNHLQFRRRRGEISQRIVDYIEQNSSVIVRYLRFPHNIEVLVSSLQDSILTKKELLLRIRSASKIEKLVIEWIKAGNVEQIRCLCIFTIFRTGDFSTFTKHVKLLFPEENYDLKNLMQFWSRIIAIGETRMHFIHPSYRSAASEYLQRYESLLLKEVVNTAIALKISINNAFIPLLDFTIEQFSSDELMKLLDSLKLPKKILRKIWAVLFSRDKEVTYRTLINLKAGRRREDSPFIRGFLSVKKFFKEKEVRAFIDYLFEKRNEDPLVDDLIFGLAPKLAGRGEELLNRLDTSQSNDLMLTLKIVGSIGVYKPEWAFNFIYRFCNNTIESKVRKKAYTALNMINENYARQLLKYYPLLIRQEKESKLKLFLVKRRAILRKLAAIDS